MASPVGRVVQHLRLILDNSIAVRDADLLERFAAARDEDAFALLLHRHGPLVFGVCRRILHSVHDAEDAFQATFLVLARRAAAIRKPESLASWLYEVAYRLARKMKADTCKRRQRDHRAPAREPAGPPDLSWREMQAVLDEELRGLPVKHRQPLLLCYLEGLTQEEAAEQLELPRGTLKRRLERGRELLKDRLGRRGLSLGAAMGAALCAGEALAVPVSSVLGAATVRAATLFGLDRTHAAGAASARVAGLAEGILRTLFYAKLKLLVLGALAGPLLALGTLLVVQHAGTAGNTGNDTGAVRSPAPSPLMHASTTAVQKKSAESLKLAIELPQGQPTVREVNDGRYNIVVKLENAGGADATVWPYLSVQLLDAAGKALAPSRSLGRYGEQLNDERALAQMEFATLKPGQVFQFDVDLADYQHDPESVVAWQLPGQGEYTLQVQCKYDRAAVKKGYGAGCDTLDDPRQPWNRALPFEKAAAITFQVAADPNEAPQTRQRRPPVRDSGSVDWEDVLAAAEARGWTNTAAVIVLRGHRA